MLARQVRDPGSGPGQVFKLCLPISTGFILFHESLFSNIGVPDHLSIVFRPGHPHTINFKSPHKKKTVQVRLESLKISDGRRSHRDVQKAITKISIPIKKGPNQPQ